MIRRRAGVLLVLGAALLGAPAATHAAGLTTFLEDQVGPVRSSAKELELVRSFDIPRDDPAYARLANRSFTYDNALAILAFTQQKEYRPAAALLDQLQALQQKTGALDFSYDTKTGVGSNHIRMNALAWVGIAAVAYRRATGSTAHDKLIDGLADYLIKSRRPDGLVPGGPEVQWTSAQQNLLMAEFFRSDGRTEAYEKAAAAIMKEFFRGPPVQNYHGIGRFFIQGIGDEDLPLDAQTFGSMFLWLRPHNFENPWPFVNFFVGDKYWGGTGYRPYPTLQAGSPNIAWTEGTLQVAWMLQRQGIAAAGVKERTDAAVAAIVARTKGGTVGPPGALPGSSSRRYGDFPDWPASAPASWLLILQGGGTVLFAP